MKGSNRGKFHGCRRLHGKKATKSDNSPRLAVSFPDEDRKLIAWLSKHKDKPEAQIVRDAVHAYLLPFKNNPTLKTTFKG